AAAQRLDPHHGFAVGRHQGLIGDGEVVVFDGVLQVALHLLALAQVGVHLRVVDAGAVAAVVLGAIERDVGAPHHVGDFAAVAGDRGDADAGADGDGVAHDGIGNAQRLDDALG